MNLLGVSTAFVAVALVGCSTSNQSGTGSYAAVPPAHIIKLPPQPQREGATIIAKRDSGFMGSALSSVLTFDGQAIAKLRPGQFISFNVAPGEHLIGVTSSDNLGPLATKISREVAADCKAGKTYVFRLFPLVGGGIVIDRVSH